MAEHLKLAKITLTGVDETTTGFQINRLSAMGAEIGFLWSKTNTGNRYPSESWIAHNLQYAQQRALHVCGSLARMELLKQADNFDHFSRRFQRIQINGRISESELSTICDAFPGVTIITQYPMNMQIVPGLQNHAILLDESGGKGIEQKNWRALNTSRRVGFAGGLGPHNLFEEVPKIVAVARKGWWVDMESRLRGDDDRFSYELALEAIRCFQAGLEDVMRRSIKLLDPLE